MPVEGRRFRRSTCREGMAPLAATRRAPWLSAASTPATYFCTQFVLTRRLAGTIACGTWLGVRRTPLCCSQTSTPLIDGQS